ncbi:MAG: hypothetical protein Q7S32_00015 [bacterium]|nr:hypothetical protein [bacterium]
MSIHIISKDIDDRSQIVEEIEKLKRIPGSKIKKITWVQSSAVTYAHNGEMKTVLTAIVEMVKAGDIED